MKKLHQEEGKKMTQSQTIVSDEIGTLIQLLL